MRRIDAAVEEFGGALVSDQVGSGKTYVALACASRSCGATVVAPAVLKDMWTTAASYAETPVDFISTESLSRRGLVKDKARPELGSLVIVDEAQHFRNPVTRRFAALARLCTGRPVILLSATPIHNRRRDLDTLLSLFVGSRAVSLSPAEVGRIVIRRSREEIADSAPMPVAVSPEWCDLRHDDNIPQLLLSLPPPLGPRDGGDGGALVVHSLIRQWISSDAALRRALIRRLQKAAALVSALESGAYPTKSDLTTWISGDDCVQLGFAGLLAAENEDSPSLLPVVRRHMSAVEALARQLKTSNGRDKQRADIIRELRRRHEGVSIVAFSQYSDTVEGLFDLLARDGSVAALTGSGARVYGGRISRADAIARFAPEASGRKAPGAADAVTLLLTTDILSEGVNLQDAGVVIHLDLPWTPARMEQRLGRVTRIGSRHERVFSYVLRPPAGADMLIRTETILRQKMVSAGIVADSLQSILPDSLLATNDASLPRVAEDIRSILRNWSGEAPEICGGEVVASAVIAESPGFVALCRTQGQYRLVASDSMGVTDDPSRVLAVLRSTGDEEVDADNSVIADAVDSLTRHFHATRALGSSQAHADRRGVAKRAALRRISLIAKRARPHERSHIIPEGAHARAAVAGRMSAGHEARLLELSAGDMPDREWLCQVAALSCATSTDSPDKIVAMILFRATSLSKRD